MVSEKYNLFFEVSCIFLQYGLNQIDNDMLYNLSGMLHLVKRGPGIFCTKM